jgi:hypothetical protein
VTSDWQDAPGNTTTLCHRKSVEVGPHTLHGSCWRETEGAKLVQRGELMKSRWGDAQRLFFEERLSETVPLLDMRPDWRRHVLACWDRRLEKRLTRRSSLGRPGPYGVGRARGGASAADGLARKPLPPYPRERGSGGPEWRIGRDLHPTAPVELGLSVWRNEQPSGDAYPLSRRAAITVPCRCR